MNCRLAASNVWHSFSFSLLGLNPNTNLNFTSSALFVNILAVAAKCFPKAHKTQNPKGKHCLAAIKFAFYHLLVASHVQSRRLVKAQLARNFPTHFERRPESREVPREGCVSHAPGTSPSRGAAAPAAPVPLLPIGLRGQLIIQQLAVGFLRRAG